MYPYNYAVLPKIILRASNWDSIIQKFGSRWTYDYFKAVNMQHATLCNLTLATSMLYFTFSRLPYIPTLLSVRGRLTPKKFYLQKHNSYHPALIPQIKSLGLANAWVPHSVQSICGYYDVVTILTSVRTSYSPAAGISETLELAS
jgi:hypothetical protein